MNRARQIGRVIAGALPDGLLVLGVLCVAHGLNLVVAGAGWLGIGLVATAAAFYFTH